MMIDHEKKIIYVDYSTLAAFKSCKELARLGYQRHFQLRKQKESLSFGHAFHAGWAAYYNALAGFHYDTIQRSWHLTPSGASPTRLAQIAFLRDLKIEGNEIPVTIESSERRNLERGFAMLEAYITRYQNEPYDNILDAEGHPMTELGFQFPLTQFDSYQVVYCGHIDRLMMNRNVRRPTIFEGKTTTQSLNVYILSCIPNDQVTGYFVKVKDMFEKEVMECVWDCVFISSRKPDMAKALTDRFWMYGVDITNDFKRQTTSRSRRDITRFLTDAEAWALDYCKWLTSGTREWPRTAPGACHKYGGCQFRNRCSLNLDTEEEENRYMEMNFQVKEWDPTKGIADVYGD